jgi:hypothetical protein
VTFDEMISALEALEGQQVTAQVVGNRADADPLVIADGILQRVRPNDAPHGPAAEEATTFVVGEVVGENGTTVGENETTLVLWPSSFMDAVNDEINGMFITTRDGVLRVYRNRPWID